jgi:hypothetical protein
VLSGKAVERITGSTLDELVVTDTIPLHADAKACKKIRVLTVSGLLARPCGASATRTPSVRCSSSSDLTDFSQGAIWSRMPRLTTGERDEDRSNSIPARA